MRYYIYSQCISYSKYHSGRWHGETDTCAVLAYDNTYHNISTCTSPAPFRSATTCKFVTHLPVAKSSSRLVIVWKRCMRDYDMLFSTQPLIEVEVNETSMLFTYTTWRVKKKLDRRALPPRSTITVWRAVERRGRPFLTWLYLHPVWTLDDTHGHGCIQVCRRYWEPN